jgi:hypothetical protein
MTLRRELLRQSNRNALRETRCCSELAELAYTNAERAFMNRRGKARSS